jgi:hypothetical protein
MRMVYVGRGGRFVTRGRAGRSPVVCVHDAMNSCPAVLDSLPAGRVVENSRDIRGPVSPVWIQTINRTRLNRSTSRSYSAAHVETTKTKRQNSIRFSAIRMLTRRRTSAIFTPLWDNNFVDV